MFYLRKDHVEGLQNDHNQVNLEPTHTANIMITSSHKGNTTLQEGQVIAVNNTTTPRNQNQTQKIKRKSFELL